MNWDAISAVGEIVGAAAVFVSLIYLASQIRQNTNTLRADAGTQAQMEWSKFNQMISQHPERDTLVRVFDPSEKVENFDDKEWTVVLFLLRSFAQQVEAQYFQYRAKLLDPEVWEAYIGAFCGIIRFPVVAEWWKVETTLPIYTASFLNVVESTKSDPLPVEAIIGSGRKNLT